jgi:hypothetical protein
MRAAPVAISSPNLQVDAQDERHANVFGVISFYQGESRPPVLASKPAVLVADLANECVLGDDHKCDSLESKKRLGNLAPQMNFIASDAIKCAIVEIRESQCSRQALTASSAETVRFSH